MVTKMLFMRAAFLPILLAASSPARTAEPADFNAFNSSIAQTKQAMMANPEHALSSALRAVAISRALPPSTKARLAAVEAEWLHGEALLYLNRVAEASTIVDANLGTAEQIAPNTKLYGDLLRSHGAIAASRGDNAQALRDYLRAHDVFRAAGVARSQSMSLQDIGMIYFEAGDYNRALDYYAQSADVFGGDTTLTLTRHNNRAEILRKQGHFNEAANAYRAALVEARKLESPLLEVRILTNLAGALADGHQLTAAQVAADRAEALASHGEAGGWKPFIFGVAAKIAFEQGDLPRAEELIGRSFTGVDISKSEMLFREYHQAASRIYEAAGDEGLALAHLKAFQRLDREAQALTASAASQLLAARFNFANQNLKISQLKQGQLKRDIEIERQKGSFRITLLSAVAGAGALITGLLLFGFISIRRSRNEVRAANTTLSKVNGDLQSALKAKTEFLATTSHEIRTPLNGILGMTQVLLADRRIGADVRERIEVVHGAGETMKALVDDILDVAKMESGKLTVVEEPTDMCEILTDVAHLWRDQAIAKGLALTVDLGDLPTSIMSDGSRVRQIAFNLLSNAFKFTSNGLIALTAFTEIGSDGSDWVRINVSDTGIGIPNDQLSEIFDAFRQVDGGTTRQFGGTGLGLAICRNLATALGGEIGVQSSLGQGTTFSVLLPVRRVAGVQLEESAQDSLMSAASVLILGGEPMEQAILRMLLACEVAATTVAMDVEEARMLMTRDALTHLLVDARAVEAADPAPALRDLIHHAHRHNLRCTLTINPSTDLQVAEALMVNADQIVVKPIDAERIVEAMRTLYLDQPEALVGPGLIDRKAA